MGIVGYNKKKDYSHYVNSKRRRERKEQKVY